MLRQNKGIEPLCIVDIQLSAYTAHLLEQPKAPGARHIHHAPDIEDLLRFLAHALPSRNQ